MLTALLVGALALGSAQAYDQGNRLYALKDYAGAAKAYTTALEAGHDARADYNLGNALFKSGRVGEAIASYRRAYALAPRDPDVRGNLAFARAYRLDKVAPVSNPLVHALDLAFHALSRREASFAAALAWLLAAAALALGIVRRWTAAFVLASAIGAFALYATIAGQVWASEVRAHPGVIVQPEVSAASGPGAEFKPILLIHDGTEVLIREARGEYLLVQLPGGAGGWVPHGAVEAIY